MTPADFRAWHNAMGYTYDTGAAALGVSRGTYADYLAGTSRTTGHPVTIKRTVALACAALAAGLLTGCAAPSTNSAQVSPTLPQAPSLREPIPQQSYSDRASASIEQWQKRLIESLQTGKP